MRVLDFCTDGTIAQQCSWNPLPKRAMMRTLRASPPEGDTMRAPPTRPEILLLATGALLLLAALFGPPVAQPAHLHHYADQRTLWGVPCALDVWSNLPFALAGLLGGWFLWQAPKGAMSNMQRGMAALFFAGLVLTAVGSAWYHLAPDDAGLAVDRHAMAIAFAGILGLLAATQVSERAGAATGLLLLLAAPASVAWWSASGNVLPWLAVQGGGMVVVLAFGLGRPLPGRLQVGWAWVSAAYAAAKVLESNDHAVFDLTDGWISGHAMKHIVAAAAALPIIAALRGAASRQNAFASRLPAQLARRVPNA
jgi:hypothetical protein